MIKEKVVLNNICESFIKNTMDFYDIPGIVAGVYVSSDADCIAADLDDDPYIFAGTGGFRNYETKDPLQDGTVFHCTSVSKLFTAMGIMKLVEEGKLSLGDRLCDVIRWMSIADKRWESITIGSMITHTSGLADVSDYRWSEHRCDENALKDYALSDEVAERKLLWKPASATVFADTTNDVAAANFRYSSMAYNLLGLVIAEASGVSFEEYMQREIFRPLGMSNTTFATYDRIGKYTAEICEGFIAAADKAGLAMPHRKNRDRSITLAEVYPYTRQHAPSSTLTSTAADILKWAAALMGSGTLTMWKPRVEVPDTGEQMGLGWFIRKQTVTDAHGNSREYTLAGHEGSDDGFRTSFWMCPELKIATVLLCNLTDAPLKKLSKQLFSALVRK